MVEIGQRLLAVAGRKIPGDSADPHVVEGQARAAQLFEQIVDHLALADRVGKRRRRADIHRHRADREQM